MERRVLMIAKVVAVIVIAALAIVAFVKKRSK